MSLQQFKQLISDKKVICPECKAPVQKFDNYKEVLDSIWDGAGDSNTEASGTSKVTLICGSCDWQERTEYWSNYLAD